MNKSVKLGITVSCLLVLGGVAVASGWSPPAPPDWLVGWTGWLAAAVGILTVPGFLADAAVILRRMAQDSPKNVAVSKPDRT